jgi:hypothetical protein
MKSSGGFADSKAWRPLVEQQRDIAELKGRQKTLVHVQSRKRWPTTHDWGSPITVF